MLVESLLICWSQSLC